MKVKNLKLTGSVRSRDILKNFSAKQLELIGSVAMLYNEIESYLHDAAMACIDFPGPPIALTSRLSGVDSVRQVAMIGAEHMGFSQAVVEMIKFTLADQRSCQDQNIPRSYHPRADDSRAQESWHRSI